MLIKVAGKHNTVVGSMGVESIFVLLISNNVVFFT
jgi:hypothetical protein